MQDFFAMGGYAFYVWGSFGLAAVFMILEPLLLHYRYRQWLRRLSRSQERTRMRGRRRQAATGSSDDSINNDTVKVEDETQT